MATNWDEDRRVIEFRAPEGESAGQMDAMKSYAGSSVKHDVNMLKGWGATEIKVSADPDEEIYGSYIDRKAAQSKWG